MNKTTRLIAHVSLLATLVPLSAHSSDSERAAGNPDFSKVTAAVDKNSDGKMSRSEWQGAGLPMSSFNMFESGRGYVTQKDYEVNPAPGGIDGDGDGFLTVEEFIEFDKKMSAAGGPGGPPPGGPPPRPKDQ
ncbi:hypothetical protein FV139_18690 [Parahaliea maris]|uniref:EF-hand domain-containing protein n=1 Tax=Parahaliea maris TaxID=2716870 RepID=A0A5C8ZPR6_9GAMM|nr:hypothetical protein [Parahaliea maris]TXS90285.1 hypothetical protein FV139_18690 [Parahaliea maris]